MMGAPDILPVIVNRSGGAAKAAGESLPAQLREAFAAAGARPAIELVAGNEIDAAISRYPNAPRIVVGGGDGTLGAAAAILAESGREMAILPLGTRNHFARQLGIPLDLETAAAQATNGEAIAVDCACAGGRTFINNASLGAYVELVREREGSVFPKLPASILAGWRVLWRLRPRRYDLLIDGEPRAILTPSLFIGNNRYEVPEGKPGERARIDDGRLSVFALAPLGKLGLIRAAFRIALTRPDMQRDFALDTEAREVRIDGKGRIGIALDGEQLDRSLPLTIAIRPSVLRVVVSRPDRESDAVPQS